MITTVFDESGLFKALSEPIRLRIVALLTMGELCVCDLTEVLGLPQSTISRHTSILRGKNLISDRRAGKWVHYQLEPDFLHAFPELGRLFRSLGNKEPYQTDLKRLHHYLKHKKC